MVAIAEMVQKWSAHKRIPVCVGTPTDRIAVLCPTNADDRPKLKFAGLGTKIGADLCRMVQAALTEAIQHKYAGFRT
jgi:adenosylcobinamide amidohydrolase